MPKIRRIPRRAGLTQKVKTIHSTQNKNKKERLKEGLRRELLKKYIEEGYSMNGVTMSVSDMAFFLGVSERLVIREVSRALQSLGNLVEGDGLDEAYRALLAMTIQGTLADRGLVLNQANNLIRAQGNSYVPFLTSAVNSSLKNLMDSSKQMGELVKLLNPNPSVVINNNQNAGTHQYLTTSEAIKMVDKRSPGLLLDPQAQEELGSRHLGPGIPEITATKQQGFRLEDDALAMPIEKPSEHETRREDE